MPRIWGVESFKERYCAATGCAERAFTGQVLWACLYRGAWPWALWARFAAPEFFAADRELIDAVGGAKSLAQVERELRDFSTDSRNREWWRRVVRLRISTRRLRRLARRYLAAAKPVSAADGIS